MAPSSKKNKSQAQIQEKLHRRSKAGNMEKRQEKHTPHAPHASSSLSVSTTSRSQPRSANGTSARSTAENRQDMYGAECRDVGTTQTSGVGVEELWLEIDRSEWTSGTVQLHPGEAPTNDPAVVEGLSLWMSEGVRNGPWNGVGSVRSGYYASGWAQPQAGIEMAWSVQETTGTL